MSVLIKKVQSSVGWFYLSRDHHNPVNGLPCFTQEEVEWLKEQNLSKEELEFCYQVKLKDPSAKILPQKVIPPVGTRIPKIDDRPDKVKIAQDECMDFVNSWLPPPEDPELVSKYKDMNEGDWLLLGIEFDEMIKGKFLIDMAFLGWNETKYKKKLWQEKNDKVKKSAYS